MSVAIASSEAASCAQALALFVCAGKCEMCSKEACLVLGATGVGKTLLLKRLQHILFSRLVVSSKS